METHENVEWLEDDIDSQSMIFTENATRIYLITDGKIGSSQVRDSNGNFLSRVTNVTIGFYAGDSGYPSGSYQQTMTEERDGRVVTKGIVIDGKVRVPVKQVFCKEVVILSIEEAKERFPDMIVAENA